MSASAEPPDMFSTEVNFVDASALATVGGELDVSTSAELARMLNAVIDRGARSLVIDVGALTFIDAAGLRVLVTASNRLAIGDGTLLLRSPSKMVSRILEMTGLTHLAERVNDDARGHLGPEQSDDRSSPEPHRVDPSNAGQHRRAMTAIPPHADVVDGALRLVVALARATVGGADGVSVSLRRHGRLSTVAASDQTISDMDADQYATGEGPCVAASLEGHWFHVESLDDEPRWPAFIPRAKELGINSILSTPLIAAGKPIGALNIYSRTSSAFAPPDQELAAVFATEASTILADAGVDVTADEVTERLQHALQTRQDIAQAQGVIMGRDQTGADAAFAVLRRVSVTSDVPLADLARDFVKTARHQEDILSELREP